MPIADLFKRDIPIKRIREDELINGRMELQMARSQARQNLQNLEQQKQSAFKKALQEKSADLRRSYESEIVTVGFRMRFARMDLDLAESQLRLVSLAESIKEFAKRHAKSSLLAKLGNLRLSSVDAAVREIEDAVMKGDQIAGEIMRKYQGSALSVGSEDIQELDGLIQQAQASAASGTDPEALAQQLNEKHSEMLEKRSVSMSNLA